MGSAVHLYPRLENWGDTGRGRAEAVAMLPRVIAHLQRQEQLGKLESAELMWWKSDLYNF